MSKDELARTLTAGNGEGVYWWDYESRSVLGAGEVVPWPITWLLSFHYKHVHIHPRKPQLSDITSKINDWGRWILWRSHFEKAKAYDDLHHPELSGIGDTYLFLRSKIRSFNPGPQHEVLSDCVDAVKINVLESCRDALDFYRPEIWSNTCGLVQLGYKLLRQSGFKAAKTDKDGGFALTTSEELTEARLAAVDSHHYKKVPYTLFFEEEYFTSYKFVCRQLSSTYPTDHQGPVYSALTRDVHHIGASGFFKKPPFHGKDPQAER